MTLNHDLLDEFESSGSFKVQVYDLETGDYSPLSYLYWTASHRFYPNEDDLAESADYAFGLIDRYTLAVGVYGEAEYKIAKADIQSVTDGCWAGEDVTETWLEHVAALEAYTQLAAEVAE